MQQLTATVQKALTELKTTKRDLSRRLGMADNYISMMLKGCTTKKQDELIGKLDLIIAGAFKSDDEIIAELSEKLEEAQQQNMLQVSASETHTQILQKNHVDDVNKLLDKVADLSGENHKLKQIINDTDESYSALHQSHANKRILLNQSEENSLYWMAKVPTTRWGAFKLFVKLMFGGKA